MYDPPERQGFGAFAGHFHGDLIGGATNAAALDLEAGLGVFHRALQHLQGRSPFLVFHYLVKGAVDNPLGDAAFAAFHDGVDQTADQPAAKLDIRINLSLNCSASS